MKHRKLEYKLLDEWSRLDAMLGRSKGKQKTALKHRKSRVGAILTRLRARS